MSGIEAAFRCVRDRHGVARKRRRSNQTWSWKKYAAHDESPEKVCRD
jgi:hypothetical protein